MQITRRWLQYMGTMSATLSIFISGMHFVWTSPSLPKLYANDSVIPITIEQGSWLASVELFADLPGAPLGAFLADYLGRKNAILSTAVPYLIAWLLIAFGTNISMLLVAKFLVGLADGSIFTILPMFVGEIAEDDIRGRLGNSMTVMLDLGALFIYCIGAWISIRSMAFIGAVFPILLFITFFKVPETPYYLLMKNKPEKAHKSLQQYRGKSDVDAEFNEMHKVVKQQMSETSNWIDLYRVPSYFKGLMILIGLKTFQQFSGIFAVLVFTQLIFDKAGGLFSGPIASIIFGSVQFLSGFMAMMVVDLVGRRPLLLISCIGCFVALSTQAIYFYFQFYNLADLTSYGWVPITTMLAFIIMYSVGLGAIPLMVPSEMFPTNIKAKALCVTDLYLAMIGFGIVKVYQGIANEYGSHIPFGVFALSCFIGIFFVIYVMPETKGRSLEEIQNLLKGKLDNKINNSKIDVVFTVSNSSVNTKI